MMTWFVAVAVVVVLGGAAAVAAGVGGGLDPVDRLPGQRLPERDLTPDDLRHLRFELVPRGYRPDEVDALLDRVAAEWQGRLDAAGVEGQGPRTDA